MSFKPPQRQHGAALVIGLILLMVLTLLGISSMNMARLELLVADNIKQSDYAFQAAETAIIREITSDVPLMFTSSVERDFIVRLTPPIDIEVNTSNGSVIQIASVVIETTYQETTHSDESELGRVDAVHFKVRAEAESGRGAQAVHHGGFYTTVPSATGS